MKKCESCGKHPAAYFCDSWCNDNPKRKICCVCADLMITKIPNVKEVLNIRQIITERKEK